VSITKIIYRLDENALIIWSQIANDKFKDFILSQLVEIWSPCEKNEDAECPSSSVAIIGVLVDYYDLKTKNLIFLMWTITPEIEHFGS
jgi:hypothetical protein